MHVAPHILSLLVPLVAVTLEPLVVVHVAAWTPDGAPRWLKTPMEAFQAIGQKLDFCMAVYAIAICYMFSLLPFGEEAFLESGIAGLAERRADRRSLAERSWQEAREMEMARWGYQEGWDGAHVTFPHELLASATPPEAMQAPAMVQQLGSLAV